MPRHKFLIPLIFFLLTGTTEASSRVAFSRPGSMIRIPNVDNSMYRSLLTLDVSSEILSSTQNSFSFSVTDGEWTSVTGVVTINVNPINDAPVLSPVEDQSLNEDSIIKYFNEDKNILGINSLRLTEIVPEIIDAAVATKTTWKKKFAVPA